MPKIKYLNEKDPWILGEDIPNCDFFFSQIWLSNFVNEFVKPGGRAYKKILCIYRGYHLWFYYGDKDSFEVGDHLTRKIVENPDFALRANKEIINWANKLRKCVEDLPADNLDKFTNNQLYNFYKKHDQVHTEYYCWGWIPVAADMFHNNLTEKLKAYLRSVDVEENNLNEYLVTLTSPTEKSLIQEEQESLLKIGIKVQENKDQVKLFRDLFKYFKEKEVSMLGFKTHSDKYENLFEQNVSSIKDKIDKNILKLVEKHYLGYFYTKYLFTEKQGTYSFDYYLKELVRLVSYNSDLEKEYRSIQKEFRDNKRKRNNLLNKLSITGKWKKVFDAYSQFMVTKIYRRYAQIYALYRMEPILMEIGKRLDLTLMQTKFMLPQEIEKGLKGGKINKKEIKTRVRLCVYYAEKGVDKVFIGKRAQELAKKVQKRGIEELNEIKGQCGCIGKAEGKVKIINDTKDMGKMKKGDVLVSIATNPDLVPAMKKAVAIVTEQGGVTSHAAIVSREFNIPCVIGTKVATTALKDGDLVNVDAVKGIVEKI